MGKAAAGIMLASIKFIFLKIYILIYISYWWEKAAAGIMLASIKLVLAESKSFLIYILIYINTSLWNINILVYISYWWEKPAACFHKFWLSGIKKNI